MVVLKVVYEPGLVLLAGAIGFIGAFGAVSTCEQYRLSTTNDKSKPLIWLWLVAFSFGGVCIWGMHFIGMASFKLMHGDTEIPIRFELANIIYLLVMVLLMIFASVYVASADDCFNRSTKEIMEKFIARASNTYSMNEIKQMGQFKMFYIVFTHSIHLTIAGGVIAGASVALMHYVGMRGMLFQGEIEYDAGIVAASCIISVSVIISGYWIFFRVLSLFPSLDILRIICACNGMFGISGLHYIGLQAATFDYDPSAEPPNPHTTVDRYQMLIGVLVTAVMISFLMLVYVLSDLRNWLLRTSIRLRHADIAIASVHKQCAGRTGGYSQISRDTTRYMRKHVYKTDPGEDGFDEDSRPRLLFNDMEDEDDSTGRSPSPGGGTTPTGGGTDAGAGTSAGAHASSGGGGFRSESESSDDDFETMYRSGSIKTKPSAADSVRVAGASRSSKSNAVMPELPPVVAPSKAQVYAPSQTNTGNMTPPNTETETTVSIV